MVLCSYSFRTRHISDINIINMLPSESKFWAWERLYVDLAGRGTLNFQTEWASWLDVWDVIVWAKHGNGNQHLRPLPVLSCIPFGIGMQNSPQAVLSHFDHANKDRRPLSYSFFFLPKEKTRQEWYLLAKSLILPHAPQQQGTCRDEMMCLVPTSDLSLRHVKCCSGKFIAPQLTQVHS